jgi:hypothetical protein
MIKTAVVLTSLLSFSLTAFADQWRVAEGGYQICDSEKNYRQLLHYALYGVGNKPATGCQLAPAGTQVSINHCVESDIILCKFTFTPISGAAINGWASKALLREIPH